MIKCHWPMWMRNEDMDLYRERDAYLASLESASYLQTIKLRVGLIYTFYKDEDALLFLIKFGKYATVYQGDTDSI